MLLNKYRMFDLGELSLSDIFLSEREYSIKSCRAGLHSIHWGLLEVCQVSRDIIGEYYFPHPHSLGFISRGGKVIAFLMRVILFPPLHLHAQSNIQ